MASMPQEIKHLYEFGPFRLNPRKRLLYRGGAPVSLTPKAIETLLVLVENRGRVVSKDELMKLLWPDSFVEESNLSQNIFLLRKALGASTEERRYILTVPGRGYQFTESVRELGEREEQEVALVVESHSLSRVLVEHGVPVWSRARLFAVVLVALTVVLVVGWWILRRPVAATEREPLFVADFTNATGDTVFDDVLRVVAMTELDRSPVFAVVSDPEMTNLLRSMGRAPDSVLTPGLTRQMCERGKGKWMAEGAIKPQGSAYTIELTMRDCASMRVVSQDRADAKNIDEVLTTVSHLAAATRLRLSGAGANATLDAATPLTSSLQAYKAFVTGRNLLHVQLVQAAAMLRRATELDPKFVDAWMYLEIADGDLDETERARDDLKRAFALRETVSGWRKDGIDALYYLQITGEIYKAIDALRSWESLQPNQFPPHNRLGFAYRNLGLYAKAAEEFRLAMAILPFVADTNLSQVLQAQGLYDQAEEVILKTRGSNQAAKALEVHNRLYEVALLRGDTAGLERERAWLAANTDDAFVVSTQAQIDLLAGNLNRARERTQHAVNMALESNLKEAAADMLLTQATADALAGESAQARRNLANVIRFAGSKTEQAQAARVMALNGQPAEAKQIMDRLVRENPSDTLLNAVDVPVVLAARQLGSGQAEQALRSLEAVKPYEFGMSAGFFPNYVRALAYLQLRKAHEAAAEFQAVLDHRGVAPLETMLETSRLGLARSYAMQGDAPQARASYQEFLTLWKDADPDIPLVKQARAEYAKLQ
jgi:DNA-binding winged helix-turn-helix (wHTH) protein/tetratricopeptide (TPR) repeat protein